MTAQRKVAALVTGGAKRIGRSISIHLAGMGYDIALHYHDSKTEAVRTAGQIRRKGVRCELFRTDLSKPGNAKKLLEKARHGVGEISVLVNSASVFEKAGFMEVTERSLENDMAVNFKSPFFATQAFAEKSRRGLVVNMLDSRVSKNQTAHFAYNLSKKCLYHFTLAAAKSLGPGIRVNAICPGPILKASDAEGAAFKKIAKEIPLRKIGKTNHVNQALEYLVSNSFVTGETLFVDGGQHL